MGDIVENALATAHEAYDAGQWALAMQAVNLAIRAAAGDRYWLAEIRKHIAWFQAGLTKQ